MKRIYCLIFAVLLASPLLASKKPNRLGSAFTGTPTVNTIPKFTGVGTVGNSSITDNGTTVSTTEPFSSSGKITSSLAGLNGGFWTANGLAKLQELGGNGGLRLTASDADTGTINISTSNFSIISNNNIILSKAGTNLTWDGYELWATNDSKSLGYAANGWQDYFGTDHVYLGGKGQTAQLIAGTQKTMTEQTDSCVVINGATFSIMFANATGSILREMGVRPANYVATLGDRWLSRAGGTTPRDTSWVKVTADSASYIVYTARVKAH